MVWDASSVSERANSNYRAKSKLAREAMAVFIYHRRTNTAERLRRFQWCRCLF